MTEQSRWSGIQKRLSRYGKLVRIENRAELGTPDVCYCILGESGWVELKYIKHWPKRLGTPVRATKFTLEQVLWAEEWEKAGGRTGMILTIQGTDFCLTPSTMRLLYAGALIKDDFRHTVDLDCPIFWPSDTKELVRWLIRPKI